MAKPIVIERDPTPDERAKILRRYNELADERGRLQGAMCALPAASRFRRRKLERAMGRVSKEMDILRDIALGDSTTLVTPDTLPVDVCLRRSACNCAGCLTLAARIRRSPKLLAMITTDHIELLAKIEALSPPPSNKLPEGKTCSDCMYLSRCVVLGVRRLTAADPASDKLTAHDVTCDWTPSRFQATPSFAPVADGVGVWAHAPGGKWDCKCRGVGSFWAGRNHPDTASCDRCGDKRPPACTRCGGSGTLGAEYMGCASTETCSCRK